MPRSALWITALLVVRGWTSAHGILPGNLHLHRNESTDPLATWLYGLRVHIADVDVNETALGMEFIVTNFVCGNLSVSRVRSKLDADTSNPSIGIDLQGLGITCRAHYRLPIASGELTAEVKPGAKASMTLGFSTGSEGIPQRAKVTSCSAELSFNFHFGRSFEQRIFNWILGSLRGVIQTGVTAQMCEEARAFARQNLTEAIQIFNHELLLTDMPSASAPVKPSMQGHSSAPPGSIDWTEVDALRWVRWVIDDLIGSKAIKQAVDWALNTTGRVVLPGSREALSNMVLQSGSSRLKISMGLESLRIDGVDGVRSWQPLTALDSSTLEAGVTIGTATRPGISVTSNIWVHLAAEGPGSDDKPIELDQLVGFSLGLEKPSFTGIMELFVDREAVQVERTMAQWMYDAKGCLQDTLLAAPVLKHFNMSLHGLSSPVMYTPHTTGVLEGDLATLFNSFVNLFNSLYLHHVPAAIMRFAASQRFRDLANTQMADMLTPTARGEATCIRPEEAAMKAREFPEKADWRTIFGKGAHKAMDNLVDGFLAHNGTNIRDALKDVGPFRLETGSTEFAIQLNEVDIGGLSQVQRLRVLQPDSADAELLSNIVDIACPTKNLAWQPTVSIAATIATAEGKQKDLKMKASLPCGEAEATLRASFNMHKYMQLPLPPSPLCVFTAFSEIALTSGRLDLRGLGQVVVELQGRAPEDLIASMCGMYPRLCDRFSDVSKLHANPAFAYLIKQAEASCSASLATVAEAQSEETEPDDAASSSPSIWVIMLLTIGVLTACLSAMSIAAAHVAKQRTDEGRPNSMAADLCADKSARARVFMVVTSALLVAAFVLRTVSTYFMSVAWSDIVIQTEDFGEVMTVRVMTFLAYKMIEQYIDAGAVLSAVLFGLMSGLAGYGIIIISLVFWVSPAMHQKRRKYLAAAQFLSRLPFMDVVTYGHFIPTLRSDMKLPLGISAQLRCYPDTAMYISIASTLCGMAAVQCLRSMLPATDEVSNQPVSIPEIAVLGLPIESCKRRTRRIVKISIPAFFLFLWTCCQYFQVRFTQLTGDLMDPKAFGPLSLIAVMWGEDWVAGLMLVILVILAPLMQAVAAILSVMGNRQPATLLLELGNTFAALDVFFAGFVACLIDLNAILVWTMNDRFGDLCAMQEALLDAGCAGTSPTIYMGSTFCLLVAAMSSSWFACSCAVVDGLRTERATSRPISTSDGIQISGPAAPSGWFGGSLGPSRPRPSPSV